MAKQTLTIATTVTIPGQTIPPIKREIDVDLACSTTVTVPNDARGCKSCFRVEGGLKDLLKFFLLNPVQPDKKPVPGAAAAPADAPANALEGFWFSTDDGDGEGQSSGHIPLTGAQIYTDKTLDTLFGKNQKELQKITFYNPTDKSVDVNITLGRDMACEETAAPCPGKAAAAH